VRARVRYVIPVELSNVTVFRGDTAQPGSSRGWWRSRHQAGDPGEGHRSGRPDRRAVRRGRLGTLSGHNRAGSWHRRVPVGVGNPASLSDRPGTIGRCGLSSTWSPAPSSVCWSAVANVIETTGPRTSRSSSSATSSGCCGGQRVDRSFGPSTGSCSRRPAGRSRVPLGRIPRHSGDPPAVASRAREAKVDLRPDQPPRPATARCRDPRARPPASPERTRAGVACGSKASFARSGSASQRRRSGLCSGARAWVQPRDGRDRPGRTFSGPRPRPRTTARRGRGADPGQPARCSPARSARRAHPRVLRRRRVIESGFPIPTPRRPSPAARCGTTGDQRETSGHQITSGPVRRGAPLPMMRG
jgi:hypothetical protein